MSCHDNRAEEILVEHIDSMYEHMTQLHRLVHDDPHSRTVDMTRELSKLTFNMTHVRHLLYFVSREDDNDIARDTKRTVQTVKQLRSMGRKYVREMEEQARHPYHKDGL